MSGVRISPEAYLALDLEAHAFLADVPLHDVSRIELPGGGPDRTIEDVRGLLRHDRRGSNPAVRLLLALRRALGRLFGWDRDVQTRPEEAYALRLSAELRSRSLVEPGTPDGPFRLVYVLPNEMLAEVRNATVHAFSCMALERREDGYRLYWAIYVKPVSWFTGWYMALIEPFRRGIVYPSIMRRLRDAWPDA